MTSTPDENKRSASNTTTWKRVIVRGTPAGRATRPPQAGRFSGCSQRNPREKLTLTIKYRGGSEGWWLIEARGRHGAFAGGAALADVMAEINRTPSFYQRRD